MVIYKRPWVGVGFDRRDREVDVPITHHIHQDLKLIVSIHEGPVRDDEFLASHRELFASRRFDCAFNRVIDLRRTDSRFRSPDALREFAEYFAKHYERCEAAPKTAVIAPGDVSYGMARMYEAFVHRVPGEFVVFRTAHEALAWLGLPEELCASIALDDGLVA